MERFKMAVSALPSAHGNIRMSFLPSRIDARNLCKRIFCKNAQKQSAFWCTFFRLSRSLTTWAALCLAGADMCVIQDKDRWHKPYYLRKCIIRKAVSEGISFISWEKGKPWVYTMLWEKTLQSRTKEQKRGSTCRKLGKRVTNNELFLWCKS